MSAQPASEHLESLNQLTDPATLLSADYRILATNPPYLATFHQGREVAGSTCYQSSHGYDRPCDEVGEHCPLQKCIKTGRGAHQLHIHTFPTGREYVNVEIVPVRDNRGETLFFREVFRQTLIASAKPNGHGLVGVSKSFIRMLDEVHKVAFASVPVLLLGESGTGKELIARAIHDASDRCSRPFVPVECSGFSEKLFESELFGHRKGSFTGALVDKDGLVEVVAGGTLFLDEIGDVPLALQIKLLRLLESHTYRKVGDTITREAKFRLVCATNRDLDLMMKAGEFRRDLYYRISTFPIHLPPLRSRREDIDLLAHSILLRISPDQEITLTQGASELLLRYDFPGNIRELVNLLERARILSESDKLAPSHFPSLALYPTLNAEVASEQGQSLWPPEGEIIPLKKLEQRYLRYLLDTYPGPQTQLAAQLGVSTRTLTRKIGLIHREKNHIIEES
ncbi:MAG: sigma 54-interacting transcriptional regulator [Magnetococcales bacterium]|nr:sigma 54-interacting transcriptional regulator [Magnetococcales bacterium]MBF0322785.1 sigma 54-interacting transcriptional regulator [Magnetococcales bacterium]